MTTTAPQQALVAADPERVANADRTIARMALPAEGLAVEDPSTGERIATIVDVDVDGALEAVAVADAAGRAWARTTPRQRADVLHAWYAMLIDRADELAHLIVREMGKPLAEARAEVQYAADFVRWYAEEAVRPRGDYRDAPGGGAQIVTRRSPVGLSVLITPWNFPLAMATRKIAPAIAAGNAAIVKPATLTPLTTLLAVELGRRAGIPEELVHVVTTSRSSAFSEAVLRDPRVRKVSFTGSTPVGRTLLALASEQVLRASMELGGNAPLLVFDDADLERAVEGTLAAKLRNGGQSCVGANRIYVQDGIADAFVEALAERLAGIRVGSGFGEGVQLGPLIDDRAVRSMAALTEDAVARGAELRTGGSAIAGAGHWFQPTLLDRVPSDSRIAQTEIFGPIAAVQRFSTQAEAIARANDTELGLAGYVFTESLDRALDVADRLETGIVGINQGVPSNAAAPFGGIKASGMGREGGAEGLEEYESIRYYSIARRRTR
ncbi:NAD-dependent succinate-semialdehyde dehydrogenase [Agrococcus sp. SL85]|uniref:NAD-dependent succinate-semialdehyde dehydrogenase n=1 Tax=Agrococcus sp. SL85 TaxID=2995141 RepID=UPI00226C807C|nr:NAD-dependent succinate-semialdehyde dehydrogenase [Agrococcus sp. SL85]WAC66048.1 NAD-dependent succinate-semialdehyde dehydrogenase [Agrococcus sp. SL85]